MGCVFSPGEEIEGELYTLDDTHRLLRNDEMCPREMFIRVTAVLGPFHADYFN